MILYGLRGISHGGAHLLTVMSPEGRGAVLAALDFEVGEIHLVDHGGLPQYHEKTAGALDRFARRHGIEVVDFPAWRDLRHKLGDAVVR